MVLAEIDLDDGSPGEFSGTSAKRAGAEPRRSCERAFALILQDRLQGVSLTDAGLFYAEQARLARLAREGKLPLMGYASEMAEESAMLMSYGPSNIASFNRTAYFVDRIILKGTKAGAPYPSSNRPRSSW